MKLFCKSILLVILVPALVVAHNPEFQGRYTKEKTLKKEYTVNPDAELIISNSYGNVDVTSWSENRIVIEVVIQANGDNEERVEKRLQEIDVDFSGNASMVSARTRLGNSGGDSWKFWKRNSQKVAIEVNYTVRLPISNDVDISNNYGAIRLNELQGKARISCDYGQLIIGELLAEDNQLAFDYTSNSEIGYMRSGEISADYSAFNLDKVEKLVLSADYTRSEIGEVGELNYDCDYGKINIGKVNQLIGSGDYIPNNIGAVSGTVNLDTDYGSIHIERLEPSVQTVLINSDYTGIKLGYDASLNFDFIMELYNAGLNGQGDLSIRRSEGDRSKKIYEGFHGRSGSGKKINISSSYGGVNLKKL